MIAAGRAAAAQFQSSHALEHVYPLIRNRKQLMQVLEAIDGAPGIVLYTVVDRELADSSTRQCKQMGLPCVSVLDPIIELFQSYLGATSRRRSGAQHVMDADYFARIDALNFTMDHDDGQLPADFNDADVVLVGISRTSKTPTSIYLANRGIKHRQYPDRPGRAVAGPADGGNEAACGRADRHGRPDFSGPPTPRARDDASFTADEYTDRAAIAEELKYARSLCARNNWPMIDVTRRSIEETAAAIVALRPRLR